MNKNAPTPSKQPGPEPTRYAAKPADFEAAAKRVMGAGRGTPKPRPTPKPKKG